MVVPETQPPTNHRRHHRTDTRHSRRHTSLTQTHSHTGTHTLTLTRRHSHTHTHTQVVDSLTACGFGAVPFLMFSLFKIIFSRSSSTHKNKCCYFKPYFDFCHNTTLPLLPLLLLLPLHLPLPPPLILHEQCCY
jgi:hypothetical protein